MFAADDNYTNPNYSRMPSPTISNSAPRKANGKMIAVVTIVAFGFVLRTATFIEDMADSFSDWNSTGDYTNVEDDTTSSADARYLERYFSEKYDDTCYLIGADNYSCAKITDGDVYAFVEEEEDGSLKANDNYYYMLYYAQIESLFNNIAISNIRSPGMSTELTNDPETIITSELDGIKTASDLAKAIKQQLTFTVHIKDKTILSQTKVNGFITISSLYFNNYLATFVLDGESEDDEPETLFTVTLADKNAEMSYYEF